ncbi:MAG: Maf family protein, partial [Fimbriimonadaceae bacterium]|nr:Maf family protein [Fimbriimonadaceae bacterium]
MPHNRLGYPVILASASPRRQELLHHLVKEFQIVVVPVDEEALTLADPWQTAQRLAREKALAVFALNPEALVIAGDTVVALPGVGGY